MNDATENAIRQEQAESFGRLMAGFSHDMKNHLGIIRESNGLMSDIIEMSGLDESEMPLERLKKAISSIEQRVIIAAEMLHHLSAFAHRSDKPCSSFQINDLITEEYALLERFARLQQINITLQLGERLTSIYNDPSLLQHVFYRLYSICLEQLDAGSSLTIISQQNQKTVEIIFRLLGNPQPSLQESLSDNLQAAIKKLEGRLQIGNDSMDHTDLTLNVPSVAIE